MDAVEFSHTSSHSMRNDCKEILSYCLLMGVVDWLTAYS